MLASMDRREHPVDLQTQLPAEITQFAYYREVAVPRNYHEQAVHSERLEAAMEVQTLLMKLDGFGPSHCDNETPAAEIRTPNWTVRLDVRIGQTQPGLGLKPTHRFEFINARKQDDATDHGTYSVRRGQSGYS